MASDVSTVDTKSKSLFTRAEVAKHASADDIWLIIGNKVYDVTNFSSHPGGKEVLVENAGQDCTEAFEDIGHSTDARNMMQEYKIGELEYEETIKQKNPNLTEIPEEDSSSGSWRSWLIPIALGVLATLVYRYFIKAH